MQDSILKVENLAKYVYQNEKKQAILNDISFNITKGEFVSIMGPSGCGKSTLLYCLTSLDDFQEGKVEYAGKDIAGLDNDSQADFRRKNIGFVFQKTTFLEKMSVLENIILPASLEDKEKEALKQKAKDLMEQMNISKLEDRTVYQASGGELQRAGICRALINDPKIIFADEPTGALNTKNAEIVINILKEINEKGTSIVMVTHDPKVAMNADRLLFMLDGRIHKDLNLNDFSEDSKMETVYKVMEEIGI